MAYHEEIEDQIFKLIRNNIAPSIAEDIGYALSAIASKPVVAVEFVGLLQKWIDCLNCAQPR